MPNGHGRTVPTMQELKRGIYLDFEGNKDQQPTLLGTMKDDQSDFGLRELFVGHRVSRWNTGRSSGE